MKNRFTLVDVIAATTELKKLQGMRVNNVYDIDNKTYLIKLSRTDEKAVILFESGVRLHQTFHDWPKSQTPSSFSMKLRKHINQKRLVSIRVVGFDRLVELVFGTEDRENRLYVELFDRGNVVLTDHELTILNILRVRTDKDTSVRWAVREKYTFTEEISEETANSRHGKFKIEDFTKTVSAIADGKEEQFVWVFSEFTRCGNPVTKEILSKCGLKAEQKISNKSDLSSIIEKFADILKPKPDSPKKTNETEGSDPTAQAPLSTQHLPWTSLVVGQMSAVQNTPQIKTPQEIIFDILRSKCPSYTPESSAVLWSMVNLLAVGCQDGKIGTIERFMSQVTITIDERLTNQIETASTNPVKIATDGTKKEECIPCTASCEKIQRHYHSNTHTFYVLRHLFHREP